MVENNLLKSSNATINTTLRVYDFVKEKKQANPTEIVKALNIAHYSVLSSIKMLEAFELIKIIRNGRYKIIQINKEVDVKTLLKQPEAKQEVVVNPVKPEEQPEKKGIFSILKPKARGELFG